MPTELIPISAVTHPTEQPRASTRSPGELDKDAFLQLLVAQLRYQNPLSPTDPNQFMAQSAQFTMVEQLTKLVEATDREHGFQQSLAAASLVGRTVGYRRLDGTSAEGVVTSARLGAEALPILQIDGKDVDFDQVISVTAG